MDVGWNFKKVCHILVRLYVSYKIQKPYWISSILDQNFYSKCGVALFVAIIGAKGYLKIM